MTKDDEITPARLRELAERAQAFTETSLPSDDEERAAFDEEHVAFAAVLRAAADRIVSLESQSNATQIAYQTAAQHLADALNEAERLTATLAAREALLWRTMTALNAADETIPARGRDGVEVDQPAYTPQEARAFHRALAAEIAAALGGTNEP